MPNPWEQRERESAPAFAAFETYRVMPAHERSLRRVVDAVGKDRRMIERWSVSYDWVLRCNAWDRHLADVENAELEAARRKAVREKVRLASRVIDVSHAGLSAVVRALTPYVRGEADEDLSPGQAVGLLRAIAAAGAAADRMLGEPQRVELSGPEGGPVEVSSAPMSDEDRIAVFAALRDSGALDVAGDDPDDDPDSA